MSATSDAPVLHDVDEDDLDDFAQRVDDDPRPASASVLDALKAQRARVSRERTFDVLVPGWGDLLVLRLGPITGKQQAKLVDRAQRTSANVDAAFLIAAFRGVLGRARTSDEFAEIVDEDDDAIGLDKRLAERLDLGTVQSAREVLEALFSGANSPTLAISSAANEWLEWGRSAGDEIDEDFLGE